MTTHIAVCGAGAFGRNHIRIYRELAAAGASIHLAAIVDPDPACLDELTTAGIPVRLAEPFTPDPLTPASPLTSAIPIYPSIQALLSAIHAGEITIAAASVCVPTVAHHEVASQLLAAGIHVLIEKPIAATLPQADDLIALATKHQCILTVGHLERFNPAVVALAPLLRNPMFFEAHRLSIFSPRSLDTDVVLDLMIHDLDIVLHLVQSPVTAVHAVGLPILSGKTDIANVRVEFASGCVANFTASRVSTERVRKLRFFQPHQYLSIDYARQDLLVIGVTPTNPFNPNQPLSLIHQDKAQDKSQPTQNNYHPERSKSQPERNKCHPEPSEGSASSPATPQTSSTPQTPTTPHLAPEIETPQSPSPTATNLPTLSMTKPQVTPGEPLRLEIESFLGAILTNTQPQVTAQQARAALALALQIQEAIATHAQHTGLQAFTTS